jgi:hypothetical protein
MNSRTKKLNTARKEFLAKNLRGQKLPCIICFQPGEWAHLIGRNVPVAGNDPTKDGMAIGLCRKHHSEYDKNTSIEKRMEFWEKYNFYSLAQKLFAMRKK